MAESVGAFRIELSAGDPVCRVAEQFLDLFQIAEVKIMRRGLVLIEGAVAYCHPCWATRLCRRDAGSWKKQNSEFKRARDRHG